MKTKYGRCKHTGKVRDRRGLCFDAGVLQAGLNSWHAEHGGNKPKLKPCAVKRGSKK